MVNKQLERLYNENLRLRKIRILLARDLEKLNATLDKFMGCFANALLKKQMEIEKLKRKEKN